MSANNSCNCSDCQVQPPVIGLTDVKFVGIDFDPKTIKAQQIELNKYLHQQWSIVKDVQTSNGLVFILGRFGELNSRSSTNPRQLAEENQTRRYN
jgi:hypothetical protein